MKIAFIGLGNMGGPMAKNLLNKGHEVFGFDLSETAIKEFKAAGGVSVDKVCDLAPDADVVISMLPNGAIVKSLFLGENGIIDTAKKGALFIDCSTIAVDDIKHVATIAQKKGYQMLDAPVSGGTAGAQAGTLTFIVGATEQAFLLAKPILECMGSNIFHAGEVGAGQVAKMCNNMLLAIQMIGTSEAINLGKAHGMNPKTLSDIMKKSSGDNWVLQKYNPEPGVVEGAPACRHYEGGFLVDLMIKDLSLADSASNMGQVSTPMGSLALNLYKLHSKQGAGGIDFSSITQLLKGVQSEF